MAGLRRSRTVQAAISVILRSTRAEAALLDISLQGLNGLSAVKALHDEHPEVSILAISAQDESSYALRALRAGAQGYITKREGLNQFFGAVRKILDGKST